MNEILLFSSPNCAPCRQLKPILQQLQTAHQFPMKVYELSESTMAVFAKHSVRMSPTVIALNEAGERVGIFVGAQGINIVENHLRKWGVING